ncbi:MAG: FixH family protein [Novosphingobium sp.]|nr:FixH family protein [Novosphingobium sp.]
MARRFTGLHMAAILVAGFGIVVGVNLVMARAAISTFGGVVVENSYVASQKFNGWLDRAEQSRSLGWDVRVRRGDDDRMLVTAANVPQGATVRAVARHPLGRLPDSELHFAPAGEGRFLSNEILPAGRWIVRLEVASGEDVWRGEQDLR